MSNEQLRESLLTCQSSQDVEIRGTILKLSRHGVAFEVYAPVVVLRTSEVLSDLKIFHNDQLIYSGRGVVNSLVPTGTSTVCEATLEDGWIDIALRSNHILEQVAATNCCNEFSNQLTGGRFFKAFKTHYGLSPNNIEFFAEHGEADTEHSNIGYELVEQFATTNEFQVRVLKALRKGLSIWWALTDGVARECARKNLH